MENVQSGLQIYSQIRNIMSLVFIIILIISSIFIFKFFYSRKFKKIITTDNQGITNNTHTACENTDTNPECLPINIPKLVPIVVFSILIIAFFGTLLNLFLVTKYKDYATIDGSISAATNLSQGVASAFRPLGVVRAFRPRGIRALRRR